MDGPTNPMQNRKRCKTLIKYILGDENEWRILVVYDIFSIDNSNTKYTHTYLLKIVI